MDLQNTNYHCKYCGKNEVKKTKFLYPTKIRIDASTNKMKLNISPLFLFTLIILSFVTVVNFIYYFLNIGTNKFIPEVIIPVVVLTIIIVIIFTRLRNTVTAYVFRCTNCGIVWLLKKNESWDNAVRAEPKFQKLFDIEKYPLRKDADENVWKCQNCGEAVPENIDVCWNCQAERKV